MQFNVLGGVIPEKDLKGFIAFRNVTFSYPTRKGDPVLKNLTLDIPEATITAIVGHSGSGKSTIASLLLRLYDPDDGKIFLDGMNIQDVCPDWLRKHIGYVSQVCITKLFHDNKILFSFLKTMKLNKSCVGATR